MAAKVVLGMDRTLVRAGERVCVAVSGGADSTALLVGLSEANRVGPGHREPLGVVLSAAHVHHGLRGADADGDEAFVRELCARMGVPLRVFRVDTAARQAAEGEGLEEAARELRYEALRGLMASGAVDAVATAHTLDDQAETVVMKMLRGAWTEGLGGISPVVECVGGVGARVRESGPGARGGSLVGKGARAVGVQASLGSFDSAAGDGAASGSAQGDGFLAAGGIEAFDFAAGDGAASGFAQDDRFLAEGRLGAFDSAARDGAASGFAQGEGFLAEGRIVRPLLGVRRAEVEAFLRERGQAWREDATNRDRTLTRNRVRHELMPLLREFNPQVDVLLARTAEIARDEEAFWQGEVARVLAKVLLPGRPVRGGGRAVSTAVGEASNAVEIARLQEMPAALRRRVVRGAVRALYAEGEMASRLSSEETAKVLALGNFKDDARDRSGGTKSRIGSRLELHGGLRVERSARELRFWRQA